MLFKRENVLKELENSKDYIKKEGSWFYVGILTKHKHANTNKVAYKAYRMWGKQGERCYNSNNCSYRYYGTKNVERLWESREFINWFIQQLLHRESWKYPVVSRKGDKGNYCVDNCELLERSENSLKVTKTKRTKRDIKKDVIKVLEENKVENRIINEVKNLF